VASVSDRKRRLWHEWLAVASIASALLVALIVTGSTTRFDNALYDVSLKLKSVPFRDDVVIVAIDPESLDEVGEWPWPRRTMADLIERIADGRPEALGIHFVFLFPTNLRDDQAVHDAMIRTRTYLAIPHQTDSKGRSGAVVRPIPLIDSAARGLGAGDAAADSDGIVRRVALFEGPHDNPSARMVLQMARLEGRGPDGSKPHNGNAETLIPFAGPPETFERVSAISLLKGTVSPTVVRDKYVLLGATAAELRENYPTPRSGADGMPSVEVDANILNSLLNGVYIRQTTTLQTAAISLSLLWLLLIALLRRGPREFPLVAMTLSALPLAAAILGIVVFGIWTPPVAYLVTVAIVVHYWGFRRL
jgi:CHASE2 domain-containing sensor protein